jgi:hypothetical protein
VLVYEHGLHITCSIRFDGLLEFVIGSQLYLAAPGSFLTKMRVTGLLSSALLYCTALAIGQESTINFNSTGLRLAEKGSSVQLYADGHDWPGVLRVVDDLAEDFGRVTGTSGTVTLLGNGTSPIYNASTTFNVTGRTGFGNVGPERYDSKGGAIIAGTIGNSTIIDRLIREGKIDVSEVEGHWEAYISTVVDNPVQGVSRAVVIAGMLGCSFLCAIMYS